ncbi:hypothetical protein [Streptomyces sp. NPDC005435]|uniref:hypothetical protein n=1 Tax=Streptomyces sp. NPDC005435 TaxID=3154464 RepID=UPI0034516EBE
MSTPPQPSQPPQPPGQPAPQPGPAPQPPGGPAPQPGPPPAPPGPAAPQPSVPPQPTAYPYPNPQSPPQANPYAQPGNPYGPPAQPGTPYAPPVQFGPPPGSPPGPPAGGGGGAAGRAVLWAVVGAVVASAAWAAGVFLIGAPGAADLRGYSAPSDLCTSADYSAFKDEYPSTGTAPTHSSLKDPALHESYCSVGLKKTGSSYSDAYLSLQLDLHRKTDPGPEFTATWKNYDDSHAGYDVRAVEGIGDEAYLVSRDTTSGSSSGSRFATLAVRDGWTTYIMGYSVYLTSYNTDQSPPALDDITDWLKSDTRATLKRLKD